jgi:hypothetical protein
MKLRGCLTVLLVLRPVVGAVFSDHTSKFGLGARQNTTLIVEKRVVTELSTCGYLNGDPKLPRTANSGYNCRVDTKHALFGFCPTTVIAASDCGLAAACIDSFSCSNGCGYTTDPSLTTWTWYVTALCLGVGLQLLTYNKWFRRSTSVLLNSSPDVRRRSNLQLSCLRDYSKDRPLSCYTNSCCLKLH